MTTVAAYRDRWSHTGQSVIGNQDAVKTTEQIGHHKRAQAALERALAITRTEKLKQTESRISTTVQADRGVEL